MIQIPNFRNIGGKQIEIESAPVGANPCGCPTHENIIQHQKAIFLWATTRVCPYKRKKMSDLLRIKSITQVHDFFGFEKPKHPLVSVIRLDKDVINYDYDDLRYVLDLYQISLKAGVKGTILYGRNSYDFEEGTMVFTAPGQVLQFEHEPTEETGAGWSLIFHPDLIRKSDLGKNIDRYSFFSYDVHEALHLSDKEKKTLSELIEKIESEYAHIIDRHSQKLIISNIELLLDYCTRYYDRQFYTRTNLNQDVLSKFEDLLKQYFRNDDQMKFGVPTVKYCGKALNMSSKYLSGLLKKETGKNAKAHIDDFLINKAKNWLLYSTDSVSEIAYDLGFEYSQHFSKMFKAKTGMSPSQYRSLN